MANEEDVLTETIVINDSQVITAFGDLGGALDTVVTKFAALKSALGMTEEGSQGAAEGVQQLNNVEEEGVGFTDALTGALGRAGVALQMAFGLGVYQIVNGVINLIKGGVQDGLDYAQAMFLIGTAVDQMRESGIDVQFQDLSSIVTDLGPKLQAFGNLDLAKTTGEVAAIAGQFGATKDQVEGLVEFTSIAQMRLGTDAVTNANLVSAALLNITNARSTQILKSMGVEISQQDVLNEAQKEGIDNGATTYAQLGETEKLQAGIALIMEQKANWEKWLVDYQGTSVGQVKDLAAAWQNLWTGWGIAITNLMPQLVGMFDYILTAMSMYAGTIQAVVDLTEGNIHKISDFLTDAQNRAKEFYNLYNNPAPTSVKGSPTTPSTTPLGTPAGTTTGATQDDITKIEQEGIQKVVDLHDQKAAAITKIDSDLGDKCVDIWTKYNRDLVAEDVTAQNKRLAIYDETANTLATDAEHQQQSSLEAQQKYQEDMQSLTDSFQANLIDALRENDAKTIIHLIEEYDNQKAEKTKQYNDAKVISDENYTQEINDVKKQEAFKLQELQNEVDQRKVALALQYDQEIQDANTQATRQRLAEDVTIQNNLKQWADGLGAQYTLTAQNMKDIYTVINAYLGKNGYVDETYTYITERMAQVFSTLGSVSSAINKYGGVGNTPYGPAVPGMAAGGSLFANTPTSVTFGEAGPELAMFMPLGSGFSGSSAPMGGGSGGGSIQLQVTLDKNLQAQIVQSSLDNVSLAIDRMDRGS